MCDFHCNESADITTLVNDVVCCSGFGSNMIFEAKNIIQICTEELVLLIVLCTWIPMVIWLKGPCSKYNKLSLRVIHFEMVHICTVLMSLREVSSSC